MFSFAILLILSGCNSPGETPEQSAHDKQYEYALVIHGGAGYATPEKLGAEGVKAYEMAMDSALQIGLELLSNGGSSLDAVENVIVYLEDNPLFNAGKGAVYTSEGKVELDASIMNGANLNAGALTGVEQVKNPIRAARAVMENSVHVMFSGHGATEFAKLQGLDIVDPEYFQTEKSKKEKEASKDKFGTVGCVALDREGNLAAGTSTGGIMNKKHGRVGDVPVIGAGTYAKNGVAGISCTGQGEFFIRVSAAHEVVSLMNYKDYSAEEAAKSVIFEQLKPFDANGGMIVLDPGGNVAMEFNTSAMYRAYGNSDGDKIVAIFK
ncbi:isoaspartyl peptidase/L-asparaginase family protein [Bacteroidota bacterium]